MNWDCFGSGLLGAVGFSAVAAIAVFCCNEATENAYDKGKREGVKERETELKASYRDPASYPKGSCVQQAMECGAKKGLPTFYKNSEIGNKDDIEVVRYIFGCQGPYYEP